MVRNKLRIPSLVCSSDLRLDRGGVRAFSQVAWRRCSAGRHRCLVDGDRKLGTRHLAGRLVAVPKGTVAYRSDLHAADSFCRLNVFIATFLRLRRRIRIDKALIV